MKIGFLEPHLRRYGGIRRIIEFSNRLVERGHEVTIYVPSEEPTTCDWMTVAARVRHIPDGLADELDVLLFNHEPQWYLLDLFTKARRRVFYALHDGSLYGKEGSWEAARAPVDRILANSSWTAERISREAGREVTVVLSGVNPDHFHEVRRPKRYRLLTMGDGRGWKGTDTIERAAQLVGVPVERYADKGLPQSAMAAEYSAAEVFVVGSRFEGFGQPGLEALACGTPLVTTSNGGSSDYAIDGETALVVPVDDAAAMAAAITRLQEDAHLRERLRQNGLQLVRDRFDWETNTDHLASVLEDVAAAPAGDRPIAAERDDLDRPDLSVVVLAWDQLLYTQRCVETLRRNTDVSWELIIVDNGSAWDARHYAEVASDTAVLNDSNLGFAAGMNAGLDGACGTFIAFCNNDTEFPPGWASSLLDAHASTPRAGITVPAVTEARNARTVRHEAGDDVVVLDPFEAPPAAVVYVMERTTAMKLGGWSEEFPVASGEDVDLAFRVWVNDLDIVFDERVLINHVGKGTAAVKLPNWRALWAANGKILLAKWTDAGLDVVRLDRCPPVIHARNLRTARSVAGWMERYFDAKERRLPGRSLLRRYSGAFMRLGANRNVERVTLTLWRRLAPFLPAVLRARLRSGLAGSADRRHMNRPTRIRG